MRLGRVYYNASYIVDLDNEAMVDEAKECIHDDVMNSVKFNETDSWIHVEPAPDASEGDIPEFLLENVE